MDRCLGLLAATLGDRDRALGLLSAACAQERRRGATAWERRTATTLDMLGGELQPALRAATSSSAKAWTP